MATDMKRFTISLTPELERDLDDLKRREFYNKTQTEMVRHLIEKGLQSMNNTQQSTAQQAS